MALSFARRETIDQRYLFACAASRFEPLCAVLKVLAKAEVRAITARGGPPEPDRLRARLANRAKLGLKSVKQILASRLQRAGYAERPN